MRRRSGGLHSEDYEGYLEVRTSLLQLCQTAESKLGVFYDESPKPKNLARRLKSQPAALSTPKDTFNDFEFDRTNECLTEQRKLSDLSITTVNVMLVIPAGSDVSTGCALASGCLAADLLAELLERYRTLPECSVDLLIRNFKRDLDELVLKVWVVYRSELPLFEMYSRTISIYFVVADQNSRELGDLVKRVTAARCGRTFAITSISDLSDPIFQHGLEQLCGQEKAEHSSAPS